MLKYSVRALNPYGMLSYGEARMRETRSDKTRGVMEKVAELLPCSLVYGSSAYGLYASDVKVVNIAGKDRQKEIGKAWESLAGDVKSDYKDIFLICSE